MRIYKTILALVASVLATTLLAATAFANSIGVEPLFLEVRPSQSAAIRVTNTSDKPIPVEVYVNERFVTEDGVHSKKPADDDFIIFPPQSVVPPNETQVFRLQSVIDPGQNSKSYYVTLQQLPVDLENTGGGAQLQVVFAFDSAVHVIPRGAKEEPKILAAHPSQMEIAVPTGRYEVDDEGESREIIENRMVPAVQITLENAGSKYLYLQDQDYIVEVTQSNGETVKIPSWSVEEVIQAAKVVLVKPGDKRHFKLPLPEGTDAKSISASVKSRG